MENWITKHKPRPKKITRKVRAWAILMKDNKIASIELCKAKPKRYTIGTWLFYVYPEDKVIPIEIIYKV